MSKIKKFSLIVILIAFVVASLFAGRILAVGKISSQELTSNSFLIDNKRILSKLKEVPQVYAEIFSLSKIYSGVAELSKVYDKVLKSTKTSNINVPEKESSEDNTKIPLSPDWYSYIPVSGSIGPRDEVFYGPYSNSDWMRVSISWTPIGYSLTAGIYDSTNNTNIISYSSASGTITISSNLDTSHTYIVWIFNNSNTTISYSGQITLSIK
jgi:hypothetical protein